MNSTLWSGNTYSCIHHSTFSAITRAYNGSINAINHSLNIVFSSGGSGVFIFGATGVARLSSGGTQLILLCYRVCNVILASGGLILNFFGGYRGGGRNFTRERHSPAPLGTAGRPWFLVRCDQKLTNSRFSPTLARQTKKIIEKLRQKSLSSSLQNPRRQSGSSPVWGFSEWRGSTVGRICGKGVFWVGLEESASDGWWEWWWSRF